MPIKNVGKSNIKETKEELSVAKANGPLIFISHDTRDAELAEEFSNLLKSASTGALKSFVSSDKRGTRGMEYGVEWYPAIMEKINEASEVICLLTKRSVERPWILYEAGVAKGKLDKKVIGIALGIKHSLAFTGPFAQFQNNDGSIEAVTKLVLDLIRKDPNLDPDQQLVERLVQDFHNKVTEILKKDQEQTKESTETTNENTVPKLFEEIKIMFENLPARIDNRIDPDFRRKRRRFHPRMIEDIIHIGVEFNQPPNIAFLMMISLFKDELPWFYEIGLETYRNLNLAKTNTQIKKLVSEFDKTFEMMGHPVMRELYGKNEEVYFFFKEGRYLFQEFFDRYVFNAKNEK